MGLESLARLDLFVLYVALLKATQGFHSVFKADFSLDAEPGVRKTALDDILIDNLSTVAERIFTLLANDDWMKNVLQPDKHEHFPNLPNPVKIISDYSKKE